MLDIGPLLGGLVLWAVGVRAMIYYGHKANNLSKPILGISLPLWMGVGGMILGFILMLASRPTFKDYFSRKPEVAPPGILEQPPPTGPVPARVEF